MVKTIRMLPDDVQHFVNVASRCDFDIKIASGNCILNAKSFLGVYGLNFAQALRVSYEGFNAEFEELLKQHSVAV